MNKQTMIDIAGMSTCAVLCYVMTVFMFAL